LFIHCRINWFYISDYPYPALCEAIIMIDLGAGMVVIIVVCVGFLMFMIVLGVIRIRSAQQRREVQVDDKPEMEWDNSALTITVNPMDQENMYDEETEMGGLRGDDTDSDDDDISISHDEIDTSEDEGIKEVSVKDRGDLEWDDSTLTF